MVLLALPALEIALLALLCALIYFGTPVLVKLIASTIPSNLPIIGDRLLRAIESAGARAEGAMKAAIYGQLHWAAKLLRYPVASVKGHLNYLLITIGSLYRMGEKILRVTIPHLTVTLTRRIDSLYHQAIAFTRAEIAIVIRRMNSLYHQAIAFMHSQIVAVTSRIDSLYHQSIAFTKAQIAALIHRLDQARTEILGIVHAADIALGQRLEQYRAQALAFTRDGLANLSHHVDQLYRQALAHADSAAVAAASTAVVGLEHETAAVLSAAWPGVLADVRGLEGALGTDLVHIGAAVRAIDLSGTKSIAEGLAVSTAIGIVALRYMEECGIPNCKNLGGLGRVLQGLEAIIGGEALFELVTEFAHDPSGAAHTVIDETGTVVQDLTRDFLHLIGL